MLKTAKEADVLVAGGGMVGLTAALALAHAGNSVVLCAPKQKGTDPRTTALLQDSVDFLAELGLWDALDVKHPLRTMRLIDGSKRLIRFQQTDFRSSEIGLDAFGHNVRNAELMAVLESKLSSFENVTRVYGSVLNIAEEDASPMLISIQADSEEEINEVSAGFVVGADGKGSLVREHFGHGTRDWEYPQSAIVLDFKHEIDSNFVSTEFHTETGPFTIVPQNSNRAGLVWLENPERALEIQRMQHGELAVLLEKKMQSYLGKISILRDPNAFPMTGLTANRFGEGNHALIGESAHVFPPIGAQGFNLGIRDIKDLVNVLRQFSSIENRGAQYHSKRAADITTRTLGVDLLNRSLLSDLLPVQLARKAGMLALGNIAPLRKQIMKLGISPNAMT